MRSKTSILYMVFICAFLAAGCSLPKKDIPQKESVDTAPLPFENKNEITSKNDFAGKAEESEEKKKKEEKYDNKIAYITIDDGPSTNNTVAILDILKKAEIKATFFVLPKSHMDDIYARIVNEGHVLGNHSYSHSRHIYASADDFEKDVLKAKAFIYKKLNYTTTVFRFPGGTLGRKKSIIQKRADILEKNGYRYFDWDVSVADTDPSLKNYGDEKFIVNLMTGNVLHNTRGKKQLIVLMHDDSTKIYTVKALPSIIEGLKKQGYTFDVLTNYKK
ncbi:polysaccharide deacetylase family protein [Ruminiclostridium cellobioparum]|uniref:Putative xylanase/chitin deacetylase n=1 Tax=Ruminiclostridium cellobioparum subsp. termitidis CT1112 TaxID=1195236 RepID=S0FKV2_RUMCE|nr:polysaccharide deacetylase family protein [Ruminiclostridium cellobioparum]EMS72507.1 putative xylanase/chitin deacetylase [Ruminiclostridium cellobioparum subsp. termitidis CT1112]